MNNGCLTLTTRFHVFAQTKASTAYQEILAKKTCGKNVLFFPSSLDSSTESNLNEHIETQLL